MKKNAVVEMGGKATIIIRFLGTATINNQVYELNTPYLVLKDVAFEMGAALETKRGAKGGLKTQAQLGGPVMNYGRLTISEVPFSRKVMSLLAECTRDEVPFSRTSVTTSVASSQRIFLAIEPPSPLGPNDIIVYDKDGRRIEINYDRNTNSIEGITGTPLVDGAMYTIFISSVLLGTEFRLGAPAIPFVSLEIQGTANINKAPQQAIIMVSKAALEAPADFYFFKEGTANSTIEFEVLSSPTIFIGK